MSVPELVQSIFKLGFVFFYIFVSNVALQFHRTREGKATGAPIAAAEGAVSYVLDRAEAKLDRH